MPQLNIAAYLFTPLTELNLLAGGIREQCADHGLKGSVLIAPEGINLFLAGIERGVEEFITWLRSDPRFAALLAKRSYSSDQPFKKLLVKVKQQIVPMGIHNLPVNSNSAQRIDAFALKAMLDANDDIVLLDTRNTFEFELGSFSTATHLDIGTFRSFPEAVATRLEHWRDKTVVTFCTGGIRCEKAAPLMEKLGFSKVLQLDGGILKYFELCQSTHYRGACFVFDERRTLNAQLLPTSESRQT